MLKSKDDINTKQVLGLMLVAYLFSFLVRMIWIWQIQDLPQHIWHDSIMLISGDGYTWAAAVEKYLYGLHQHNPGIRDVWSNGIVLLIALFVKLTHFSLDSVMLYAPIVISSFIVVPIILISRIYSHSVWGFLSALMASVVWSYYNRTMAGYYDTDIFAVMVPLFILYFFIKSTVELNLKYLLYASIIIVIYPFLYDQGKSIIYALGLMYILYILFYNYKDKGIYPFVILTLFALFPFPIDAPYGYIVKILGLVIIYFVLKRYEIKKVFLMVTAIVSLAILIYFGNIFGVIWHKVLSYLSDGTVEGGLKFYDVHQTIKEGKHIDFGRFADRISGSSIGFFVGVIGYIMLVMRHKAFILTLPLVGIGVFALFGGLRFTIYATPIFSMSTIYLFFVIGHSISDKKFKLVFIAFSTLAIFYPNIQHIIKHKVPTVLTKNEVNDLEKLRQISNDKDYTLAWWDYGYPIWYYTKTSTIIDGGKHANDNFIISTILQTSSPKLAANLSRLSVETYVDLYHKYLKDKQKISKTDDTFFQGGISSITKHLFKNQKEDNSSADRLLNALEEGTYKLPKKSRDIYLYMSYRMLKIFPTIAIFGNIDLATGQEKQKITFMRLKKVNEIDGKIVLEKGVVIDTNSGEITIHNGTKHMRNYIITRNTKAGEIELSSKTYDLDGGYAVVYMKSYDQYAVMDTEILNSMYVQMFLLGKYDKDLFELVVSSVHSRIYKVKI